MSKSKIIAAGTVLIVLVIVAAFSAMSIVQAKSVADVEKIAVTDTGAASVKLKWKKVSAADGYYIYQSPAGEQNYEKVATVEGERTVEGTVENLEQATEYDFYVTAYKDSQDNVESKEVTVLTVCTKPLKQKIVSFTSEDAGVAEVEWEINPKAEGYQLQFIKGDGSDFKDAETVDIEDKATNTKRFEALEEKATYAVRVRSYIHYQDKLLPGKWSKAQSVTVAEKMEASQTVDATKPMVALTFDDGPGYNHSSDKILDILEKYGARATFFMVGQNAQDHPDNLKRKVALGCELGNHTWDHNHYGDNVTKEDISKASDAIKEASGGYAPTCFRSPGGNTTELIREECKAEGMALYYWSLDTRDWKTRNADSIYDAVMNHIEDGDIVLMHEIYDSTAEAIERIVPELIQQGYQLVTCQELVRAKTGKNPEAGQQYFNATTIKNETS